MLNSTYSLFPFPSLFDVCLLSIAASLAIVSGSFDLAIQKDTRNDTSTAARFAAVSFRIYPFEASVILAMG